MSWHLMSTGFLPTSAVMQIQSLVSFFNFFVGGEWGESRRGKQGEGVKDGERRR